MGSSHQNRIESDQSSPVESQCRATFDKPKESPCLLRMHSRSAFLLNTVSAPSFSVARHCQVQQLDDHIIINTRTNLEDDYFTQTSNYSQKRDSRTHTVWSSSPPLGRDVCFRGDDTRSLRFRISKQFYTTTNNRLCGPTPVTDSNYSSHLCFTFITRVNHTRGFYGAEFCYAA